MVSDIMAGDGKLVNLFLRCRDNDSSKSSGTPTVKGTLEIAETPATAGNSINKIACNSRGDLNSRDSR